MEATGAGGAAGIGGGKGISGADITINGGTVTATGGGGDNGGAGIGGGSAKDNRGNCGHGHDIKITGGTVTATGVGGAAGIGGGQYAHGYNITISGGNVTAIGAYKGAGIGGGDDYSGHDITISGGTVTAGNGGNAAAIGGGDQASGYNITISGGEVTAGPCSHGAGIGGGCADGDRGNCGYGYDITISGGKVTASGADGSAGIGGGQYSTGHDITISGGEVTANGGYKGAGIGGGDNYSGYNITISGGRVTATPGTEAAGIGGGHKGQGNDITFSGGTVVVNGYIGSGHKGSAAEKIHITGGSIFAYEGIGCTPDDNNGHSVYKVSCRDVATFNDKPVTLLGLGDYGQKDLYPSPKDLDLYLWLPNGAYDFIAWQCRYTVTVNGKNLDATRTEFTNPIQINGESCFNALGTGWTYDGRLITLNEARDYVITGSESNNYARLVVAANATVKLNGATMTRTDGPSCIEVTSDATDAKIELSGDSTIYSQGGNGIALDTGAKATLSGTAALVGGKAKSVEGRGINVASGATFVMDGGTIKGYTYSGEGGGVHCAGTMTMNGGKICDNKASGSVSRTGNGAGITVDGGKLDLLGGEITGNTATRYGGAVYAVGSTVTIAGGTLSNNQAAHAGCLEVEKGSVTMTGGVIKGNTDGDTNNPNGIRAENRGSFSTKGGVFGAAPTSGQIVSGFAATKVSDNYIVGQAVTVLNGKLAGGTYTFDPSKTEYTTAGVGIAPNRNVESAGSGLYRIVCENSGLTVGGIDVMEGKGPGWAYNGTSKVLSLTNAQEYVLSGVLTNGEVKISVTANATVTLDHATLISTNSESVITFEAGATDATLKLVGDNTVYATNKGSPYDAAIRLCYDATEVKVTLTGDGALVGGKSKNVSSRCVYVGYDTTFVMDGGTITNYTYQGKGGAIYNYGTMTMNGGTISDCEATGSDGGTGIGGAIFNEKELNIYGGAIENCRASRYGGAIADAGYYHTYIYGGTFKGNTAPTNPFFDSYSTTVVGYLYGGVWVGDDYDPSKDEEVELKDGATVIKIGNLFVVGKDMAQYNGKLSGGSYAFDPREAEYAAEGLKVDSRFVVAEQAGTFKYVLQADPDGLTINGTNLADYSGAGWSFTNGVVTLGTADTYLIKGTNTQSDVRFVVTNDTAITLENVMLKGALSVGVFALDAVDVTLTLKGTNTVYASTITYSSFFVPTGAKLTVAGDGALVGGRSAGAYCRGFMVAGELVLDGGTIRDYRVLGNGGGFYCSGTMTMNGGMICDCRAKTLGGGVCVEGMNAVLTMNGGTITGCSAIDGAAVCQSGTASGSAFYLNGGTIADNACSQIIKGGMITIDNKGVIKGGTIGACAVRNVALRANGGTSVYGGVFVDNGLTTFTSGPIVYGAVCDHACVGNRKATGKSCTKVGGLYLVGKNIESRSGELVRGEFTFCPTNAEYKAAGVVVSDDATLLAVDETDYRLSTIAFPTDKIGVCSWSWGTNMAGVLEQMDERGVTVAQLSLVPWLKPSDGSKYDPSSFGPAETKETFEAIVNKVTKGELTVVSTMVVFPHEDWSSYEAITNTCGLMYTTAGGIGETIWEVNSNLVEQAAILSEQLGVTRLSVSAGFLMKPIMIGSVNANAGGAIGLDRLHEACLLCAQHNVTLLLEAGQYSGTNTMSIIDAYETKYGPSNLGISFDAANNLIYGNDNPPDAFAAMKSRVVQVHVSDTFEEETNRVNYAGGFAADVTWGTGDVSVKYDFLKVLRDNDFAGDLLVECQTKGDRASDVDAALKGILVANNTDPADKWVSPTVVPGETEDECCETALKAQGFKTDVAESLGTTALYTSFRGWAEAKGFDPNGLTTKDGVVLASAYDASKVEDPTNIVMTVEDLAVGTNDTTDVEMTFMVNVEADGYDPAKIDENLLKASLGVEGTTDLEETAFSPDALELEFGTVTEGRLPVTVVPKKVAGENPEKFFLRTTAR